MLGRIIALIIALIIVVPVGLIAALSMFFVVVPTRHTGYGPYTAVAPPSAIGGVGMVEIVVVLMAVALLVLFVSFIAVMWRSSGAPGSRRDRLRARFDAGYGQTDTQLIQELNHIATRLEARIEVLETLMLERPGVTTKR